VRLRAVYSRHPRGECQEKSPLLRHSPEGSSSPPSGDAPSSVVPSPSSPVGAGAGASKNSGASTWMPASVSSPWRYSPWPARFFW